jgi:hypothetical protein
MIRPVIDGMRWVLLVGSVLVLVAGAQLYLLTDYTDVYFAWTIEPPLTAAFLGAFYWTACVLALLSGRERIWARARVGVVGVLLFVTLTLVTTLLHLDRFHLAASDPRPLLAAWFWLLVYLIDLPVLLALLLLQLRVPGGDPPPTARLPAWFRAMAGLHAALALFMGAAMFTAPLGDGVLAAGARRDPGAGDLGGRLDPGERRRPGLPDARGAPTAGRRSLPGRHRLGPAVGLDLPARPLHRAGDRPARLPEHLEGEADGTPERRQPRTATARRSRPLSD